MLLHTVKNKLEGEGETRSLIKPAGRPFPTRHRQAKETKCGEMGGRESERPIVTLRRGNSTEGPRGVKGTPFQLTVGGKHGGCIGTRGRVHETTTDSGSRRLKRGAVCVNCASTDLWGAWVGDPYAQLKGNWSSMKNGKPLFHHVLQWVSCWKKELPDGDCRQGRRDYTKCPGTRSRGTWAGDRCYPTASKVHRRQLVADARPDSAQKTGCQGHRFPIHRCTVGPRRHFDGRRESLHASTRGVPSCGAGAHRAPGVGRVASNRRP